MAAVDIARIRLYNIPVGVIDDKITEHLNTSKKERTRRLKTDTYTGELQTEYELIVIYLTLAKIYDVEDTFFINGIPEEVNDIKVNARHFSREDLDKMILKKESQASENIALILEDISTEENTGSDEVKTIGSITMIAVGGNSKFKDAERSR